MSAAQCPECRSYSTEPAPFGDDIMGVVLRESYPNAKRCLECNVAWDEDAEMRKAAMGALAKGGFVVSRRQFYKAVRWKP